MAKLVLHIGTHKTATTTIQETFAANADLLRQHGLIYPDLGKASGHHGLSHEWNRTLPAHFQYPRGGKAAWKEVAKRYSHQEGTVFLSSENLSLGHPNAAPDYTEIKKRISAFDEVLVVAVVREQCQFMQSAFLEVAKKGLPPPPAKLVRSALSGGYCTGLWLDYASLYDQLRRSFEPEEIHFLDFDKARKSPSGILGEVLKVAGIDRPEDLVDQFKVRRANPSPAALPSWAAGLINHPQPVEPWLLADAVKAFQQEYGAQAKSFLFTKDEVRKLEEYFRPLNTALAGRLEETQPGFSISPLTLHPSVVSRDRIKDHFWVRLGRLIKERLPR